MLTMFDLCDALQAGRVQGLKAWQGRAPSAIARATNRTGHRELERHAVRCKEEARQGVNGSDEGELSNLPII